MISLDSTPEDIDAVHHERFHHPHPGVQEKREAVYPKSRGPLHEEICRLSRIGENTLRSYPRQFREGGVERLKRLDSAKPQGQLTDHREPSGDYSRKDPPRSTAQAAADIARITGIRRGLTRVRKSLEGIGLRLRKVGMIPAEADAEEQRRFVDEQLWPRPRRARRLRRVARFVDAAHFVHGSFLGYLGRFVRLLIRGPSGRQRFDVLGAIDAVTHQLTTVTDIATIDAGSVRELLRAVRGRPGSLSVTLVLGNARYRRCEVVEQEAKRLRIEWLDLPSYSPNSNPIERLWKFVAEEALSCRYHEDFARFRAAIVACLNQVGGEHRSAIASLLTLEFQTFEEPQLLTA